MGSYFEIMHNRREKKDLQGRMANGHGDGNGEVSSERTPLLRDDSD